MNIWSLKIWSYAHSSHTKISVYKIQQQSSDFYRLITKIDKLNCRAKSILLIFHHFKDL